MKVNWAVGLVVGMSILHHSIMGYAGYDPSAEAENLMVYSLALMFSWWVIDDANKQKYHCPYEFGAFIFFAWPIVLPLYLVETRGWKGILVFPIFVFLFYLPWLIGWAAYYLNSSNQ